MHEGDERAWAMKRGRVAWVMRALAGVETVTIY
jgi:hypothetical protein